MFNSEIQYGRVTFRSTTKTDLDDVMMMEKATENAPFVRQWSEYQHQSAISDDNMAHLIVQRTSDNKVIGYIILVGLKNPDQSIEFKRIVIGKKQEGFGRESVRLVKKIAFEKLGAHRLWLEVMEHNDRAIRLYETEGFVCEGLHRESLKQEEQFVSLRIMSILAHEYNKKTSISEVQFFPNGMLELKSDVPGAKMWGVALRKAMLTYFEVQPNCRFEKHSHESEQITFILEGKLFFEVPEDTICVRQGEVIAIPSDIPHAVFTTESCVKAVDAWSPVMEKYR